MPGPQPIAYKFAPFILKVQPRTLQRGDDACPLRRQSYSVLRCLVERSGRVVAVRDIAAELWSKTAQPADPDGSITQCIGDIRRALGDEHKWMVETVTGGYQFTPDVTAVFASADPADQAQPPTEPGEQKQIADVIAVPTGTASPTPSAGWSGWHAAGIAATVATIMSLVVWSRLAVPTADAAFGPDLTMMAIPSVVFVATSASPMESQTELQAFTEEVATELRRAPRGYDLAIKIASPSQHRDAAPDAIAKALDVRYALKISVREAANARQFIVQLIEAPTGRQIWAAPVIQPVDSLQAQNLVAARLARQLTVQIRTAESVRPLPPYPQAGHYTLQGRVLLESERDAEVTLRAMALFDKALALNPKHTPALLGFARTRVDAVANGWVKTEEWPKVLADAAGAVDRVIERDATNVGAHLLRGTIERTKGNFDRAVVSFEHTRDLNPNYPFVHAELGRTKLLMGKLPEAIAHIERAETLSPTDPTRAFWYLWAGMAAAQAGDFNDSLVWLLKSRQANPRFPNVRPWLAIAYAKTGDVEKARQEINAHLATTPKFTVDSWTQAVARGNTGIAERISPFAPLLLELGVPARS
jgi:DNA-binding winged helix-turn-helix (wHTH) protein/tetratricopeptide (TPR) repeat protein